MRVFFAFRKMFFMRNLATRHILLTCLQSLARPGGLGRYFSKWKKNSSQFGSSIHKERFQPYDPNRLGEKGKKHLKVRVLRVIRRKLIFFRFMVNFDLFFAFLYLKRWFRALKICHANKDNWRLYVTIESKKSNIFRRKGEFLNAKSYF